MDQDVKKTPISSSLLIAIHRAIPRPKDETQIILIILINLIAGPEIDDREPTSDNAPISTDVLACLLSLSRIVR